MQMQIVWLVIFVAAIVIELAVPGLVSIWFALGAIAALLSSYVIHNTGVQIAVFAAVSILLLVLTKPLVKKHLNKRIQPTNADALVGQSAVVIEDIDEIRGQGQVKVRGQIWSAKPADHLNIPAGRLVEILRIEGVKLVVAEKTVQK